MLASLPLSTQPLATQGDASAPTDDTIVFASLGDDALALEVWLAEFGHYETALAAPPADAPVATDDTIIAAMFADFELGDTGDDRSSAFDAWVASPFDDGADTPPPPPPQPGPLSALGGAGWFADVPASRRKKPKPTWPNLPPAASIAPSWKLTTVTTDTARLRAHRAVKALRTKLKRETKLEDHVIAGIVAALMADQDKDD